MTPLNENFMYLSKSESRQIINFNVLQNIVTYGTRLPAEFANCTPVIKISRKFCAPSFGNSAPGLQVCAGSF